MATWSYTKHNRPSGNEGRHHPTMKHEGYRQGPRRRWRTVEEVKRLLRGMKAGS